MVEAEGQDHRGGEDRAGDGDAVAQDGLLGATALESGRGREEGAAAPSRGAATMNARRNCITDALISITADSRLTIRR